MKKCNRTLFTIVKKTFSHIFSFRKNSSLLFKKRKKKTIFVFIKACQVIRKKALIFIEFSSSPFFLHFKKNFREGLREKEGVFLSSFHFKVYSWLLFSLCIKEIKNAKLGFIHRIQLRSHFLFQCKGNNIGILRRNTICITWSHIGAPSAFNNYVIHVWKRLNKAYCG